VVRVEKARRVVWPPEFSIQIYHPNCAGLHFVALVVMGKFHQALDSIDFRAIRAFFEDTEPSSNLSAPTIYYYIVMNRSDGLHIQTVCPRKV